MMTKSPSEIVDEALGIDWHDTESAARRVAEWASDNMQMKTVQLPREIAIDALSMLASADALIRDKVHTNNPARSETIQKLCAELGVTVRVERTG